MSTILTPLAPTRPSEINPVAGASPRQMARMAGVLYLVNIVLGAFAEMNQALKVRGEAG